MVAGRYPEMSVGCREGWWDAFQYVELSVYGLTSFAVYV